MTENGCHCEEAQRADAAIRIPRPEAPLCKGSCHGFAVTEGLPGVAGYFGDDLCSDSRPSLAHAGAGASLRARWLGLSVGADDLTDAPNFGMKFGRRKPYLRYIGPLLGLR